MMFPRNRLVLKELYPLSALLGVLPPLHALDSSEINAASSIRFRQAILAGCHCGKIERPDLLPQKRH
jgi:hypothetical protein